MKLRVIVFRMRYTGLVYVLTECKFFTALSFWDEVSCACFLLQPTRMMMMTLKRTRMETRTAVSHGLYFVVIKQA